MPDSARSVSSKFVSALVCAVSVVCGLVLLTGCAEEPQIVRQKVPKPPRVESSDRMLAAIVPAAGRGWFFKLSGSKAAVDQQEANFGMLLNSLTVTGEKVNWKIPTGWSTKAAASEMRVATLLVDGTKLECAISFLPSDDPTTNDYLLANINRWRGQIGLGHMSAAELPKEPTNSGETRLLKLADGTLVTWVDLVGTLSSGGAMPFAGGAPFANRPEGGSARPPMRDEQRPTESAKDEFTYTKPEGWKKGPKGEISKVSFKVGEGKESVEITVTPLLVGGSSLLPNINRWCQQVGLPPFDDAKLQTALEKIEVDSHVGQLVELVGANETILGAIVVVGEQGWFFKLRGNKALAAQEKVNFATFVKSVKFK